MYIVLSFCLSFFSVIENECNLNTVSVSLGKKWSDIPFHRFLIDEAETDNPDEKIIEVLNSRHLPVGKKCTVALISKS